MLRTLLIAALALAALLTGIYPEDASAGRWRRRPAGAALTPCSLRHEATAASLGYVIPTAPYAYPVVYNCLRRYPVPRPWGVGWRETWVC